MTEGYPGPDAEKPALRMALRTIALPDGRTLIFYTFSEARA